MKITTKFTQELERKRRLKENKLWFNPSQKLSQKDSGMEERMWSLKVKKLMSWYKNSTVMIMIINENPSKTNYINKTQHFIINWPMSSLFLSTAPQWLPFLFVYMLSMSYGMEYPFDQMEPAVQLCPLPTPFSLDIHSLPGQD